MNAISAFRMSQSEESMLVWEKLNEWDRKVLMCMALGQAKDLTCIANNLSGITYNKCRRKVLALLNCQTDVDVAWASFKLGWVKFQGRRPLWVGNEIDNRGETMLMHNGRYLQLDR